MANKPFFGNLLVIENKVTPFKYNEMRITAFVLRILDIYSMVNGPLEDPR